MGAVTSPRGGNGPRQVLASSVRSRRPSKIRDDTSKVDRLAGSVDGVATRPPEADEAGRASRDCDDGAADEHETTAQARRGEHLCAAVRADGLRLGERQAAVG